MLVLVRYTDTSRAVNVTYGTAQWDCGANAKFGAFMGNAENVALRLVHMSP